MTMSTVEVLVPCDVYTIKVRLGPQVALSPLEMLFLQAVLREVHSFEELTAMFGIGRRATLDLVFDLWQKGYVVLDLGQGQVRASAKISEEKLDQLETAESTEEPRDLMLDRLTGEVMPVGGRSHVPREWWRAVVPADQFETSVQNVQTPALLAAVGRAIEKQEYGRAGGAGVETRRWNKVLAVNLSPAHLSGTTRRRWLPVYLQCWRDEDAGRLQLIVVESEMSAEARVTAIRRIGQILEEQPQSEFARYLDAAATAAPAKPASFEDLVGQLETQTETLQEVQPGLRDQRHDRLVAIADQIEGALEQHRNAEVELEIVTAQEKQMEWMLELVRSAERQVVIASTWITTEAVQRLRPVLRERLERGVQFFVLWGFKPDDELDQLDQSTRNALLDARTRYPALFFLAHCSCRVHGKLVIQDDRRALISSMNILRPSEPGTLEVGVVLSALEGRACAPIEAALVWAREHYPDFVAAQALYTSSEEFRGAAGEQVQLSEELRKPASPANRVDLASEDEALDAVSVRLWRGGWRDYARASRALASRFARTAKLLRDGQHHDMFWRALRSVKQRLLISSDRLGPEVFNEKLVGQLRKLLEEDVFVTLLYRRMTVHSGPRQVDIEHLLAELQEYPRFRRLERNNHSKVLVSDNNVVISSFNFLSFFGYYAESRASQRRRQRSEVGVLVDDPEFANAVLAGVTQHSPSACEGWPPSAAPYPRADVATVGTGVRLAVDLGDVLRELAQAPDEVGRATVLREWIGAVEDPWSELDRLEEAQLSGDLLRVVAAATLWRDGRGVEDERRRRWQRWLVEDLWQRKCFVEAAVLEAGGLAAGAEGLPRPAMVLLAAAQATGNPKPVLAALSDEGDLTATERAVVAGVSLADVALHGNLESLEVLKKHETSLPPPWRAVVAGFIEYWEQAWQGLPMHSIHAAIEAVAFQEQVQEAFQQLGYVFDRVAKTHFKFAVGTKTHQWLFAAEGPFGELEALIVKRDAAGIGRWLAREKKGRPGFDQVGELMDHASRQVDSRGEIIEGNKRVSYQSDLEKLIGEARGVAALAEAPDEANESRLVELAGGFAATLQANWKALKEEVAALDGPERVVLSEALDGLRVVLEWGEV